VVKKRGRVTGLRQAGPRLPPASPRSLHETLQKEKGLVKDVLKVWGSRLFGGRS